MATRADEIEHLKPKSKFPDMTFDWDNLHLICSGCNRAKSHRWDNTDPILDPVQDGPIGEHLTYHVGMRKSLTKRGVTTIEHADLNRENLVEARWDLLRIVLGLIQNLNDKPDVGSEYIRQELLEMCDGKFGSFIRFVIEVHCKDLSFE